MEKKYPKYIKNFMPNAPQRQYQASEAGVKLKRKRFKPDYMDKYNLTYEEIGVMFGYKNGNSFHSSPRRQLILDGVEELIKIIEKRINKEL